jgi:hypothetical protein
VTAGVVVFVIFIIAIVGIMIRLLMYKRLEGIDPPDLDEFKKKIKYNKLH